MFGGFLQHETLNMQHRGADLTIIWFTWRWKKFTQSCLCKSPSNQGPRFTFHLQEPKISSPSICAILIMQANPGEYFRITFVGSPDWIALYKNSSFYQALDMVDHPAWNDNTMSIVWKLERNHPMLQHTYKLPFCQTI
jgi:hypothetical protein